MCVCVCVCPGCVRLHNVHQPKDVGIQIQTSLQTGILRFRGIYTCIHISDYTIHMVFFFSQPIS